jgi:DsbC/DsbD-like thiol-disulfide interchange protein
MERTPAVTYSCLIMFRAAFLCILYFVFGDLSRAEENPLRIALVSEVTSIQPGKAFFVGLRLRHQSGDHTYWKFPGIVGVPTNIEWTLPDGFKAGPIEWPEPQRVLMFQIKAQGYEGETLLPVRITPPKSLKLGDKVLLRGKASWMCCGRTCNPGFEDLSLELTVSRASVLDEKLHPLFETARAAAPRRFAGWKAEARRLGGEIHLTLTAVSQQARERAPAIKELIFYTDDGLINADKEQVLSRPAPGVLAMKLLVSEYATDPNVRELRGVLQTPQGWSPDGTVKSVMVRAKIAD